MAGLQGCMWRAFKPLKRHRIVNNLQLYNKVIVLHQTCRGKHDFTYQLPIYRRDPGCKKLLQSLDCKWKYVYRLASTNVTTGKTTDSDQITLEVTNNAVKNDETGISEVPNTLGEIDNLPPVPSPDSPIEVADLVATGLKEPTLQSLGLAKWYIPSGMIQNILEFLHVNLDMPWWAAIATVTFTTRLLLLPLSAKIRRNAVNARNCAPELQRLQREFTDARHSGSYYDAALAAQNLHKFMTEKKIGISSSIPIILQIPVFLTVFFGLKGMKEVESLKTGGMLWFTDMTVPDPYYILPFLSAASTFAALQIGSETGKLPMPQQQFFMKIVKIGFPCIIFFAVFKFPSCLVFYWTVSNFLTLFLQCLFLIPAVAKFFKIPEVTQLSTAVIKSQKKGFRESLRDSIASMKVVRELADRERLNTVTFEKAGTAPIQRTFKTNPKTSVSPISSSK